MNKRGEGPGNLGGGFWKVVVIAGLIVAFATGFLPIAIFSSLSPIVWVIVIILLLFIAVGGRKK